VHRRVRRWRRRSDTTQLSMTWSDMPDVAYAFGKAHAENIDLDDPNINGWVKLGASHAKLRLAILDKVRDQSMIGGRVSNQPDSSEIITGSWTLVSRIEGKQELLCDVEIEKLSWIMGGEVYYAMIKEEDELRRLYEKLKAKFEPETCKQIMTEIPPEE
jgi:hypothetical protein